jgi:hypothetical protein
MSDGEGRPAMPTLRVRQAGLIYLGCLLGMVGLALVAIRVSWMPGWIAFVVYGAIGVFLNRRVLRRLIHWHPVYNTISNVSGGKLQMLLAWPLAYPLLFFRLGVMKYL